jgi:hypothetical protein
MRDEEKQLLLMTADNFDYEPAWYTLQPGPNRRGSNRPIARLIRLLTVALAVTGCFRSRILYAGYKKSTNFIVILNPRCFSKALTNINYRGGLI